MVEHATSDRAKAAVVRTLVSFMRLVPFSRERSLDFTPRAEASLRVVKTRGGQSVATPMLLGISAPTAISQAWLNRARWAAASVARFPGSTPGWRDRKRTYPCAQR